MVLETTDFRAMGLQHLKGMQNGYGIAIRWGKKIPPDAGQSGRGGV